MDENTWRLAQIVMWLVGVQTTIILAALGFVWSNLSRRTSEIKADSEKSDKEIKADLSKSNEEIKADLSKSNEEIKNALFKLETRIDKLENKIDTVQHSVNELDKRVYGIETVLHMKDCCVLKQDQNLKKAE